MGAEANYFLYASRGTRWPNLLSPFFPHRMDGGSLWPFMSVRLSLRLSVSVILSNAGPLNAWGPVQLHMPKARPAGWMKRIKDRPKKSWQMVRVVLIILNVSLYWRSVCVFTCKYNNLEYDSFLLTVQLPDEPLNDIRIPSITHDTCDMYTYLWWQNLIINIYCHMTHCILLLYYTVVYNMTSGTVLLSKFGFV